ncbi:hypothetical protein LTSERUB_6169, partial [Salmonella enterica subsp. enterica serovar Rubislaw str. A4-653]
MPDDANAYPAAFKTDPAQVGVGFDDALQRWRDDVLFGGQHGFFAFF